MVAKKRKGTSKIRSRQNIPLIVNDNPPSRLAMLSRKFGFSSSMPNVRIVTNPVELYTNVSIKIDKALALANLKFVRFFSSTKAGKTRN